MFHQNFSKIVRGVKSVVLNENYSTAKNILMDRDGASSEDVDKMFLLHKTLKDRNILSPSEKDIDKLVSEKSFTEINQILSSKNTQTKSLKRREEHRKNSQERDKLKDKIIIETPDWIVYEIDTAQEMYTFHGKAEWCVCSDTPESAENYFDQYSFDGLFYVYEKVNKGYGSDKWDYVALLRTRKEDIYYDKKDISHTYKEFASDNTIKPPYVSKGKAIPGPNFKCEYRIRFQNGGEDLLIKFEDDVDRNDVREYLNMLMEYPWLIFIEYVDGDFDASNIDLNSTENMPTEVKGVLNLSGNYFEFFDFEGDVYCRSLIVKNANINKVKFYSGLHVSEEINFSNSHIKELGTKIKPIKVINTNYITLDISHNELEEVNFQFESKYFKNVDVSNNRLKTLEGLNVKVVDGKFDCSNNKLTSLEGCPYKVSGDFVCSGNSTKFTEEEVRSYCEVGGKVIV